jgi:hypothetical protein
MVHKEITVFSISQVGMAELGENGDCKNQITGFSIV